MPEVQLDDLTLIVIQPGEGRADSPRQFGSLAVVPANSRLASGIGRLASGIGLLVTSIGCLIRTVPRPVRHINRQLVPRMHINRQLVPRMVLPVRFHPESESGAVYPEFLGHLSDRPAQINHHLGGVILKFRRIPFRIIAPRHFIPPLPT
jgi:hypothetical protein